jgi:hypothetical protein
LQTAAWDYIIVYESGDAAASAASLADGSAKGEVSHAAISPRLPAPFHFVVDSATSTPGALDGELEVTTRWRDQIYGTPHLGWPDARYYHLKPEFQNGFSRAVAVCVIGDVTRGGVSLPQTKTLVELLQVLEQRFNIPQNHILFQWEQLPNADHATRQQRAFAARVREALN